MQELYYADIIVYGFHGCEASTKDKLLAGIDVFGLSQNRYDWLGSGIYFWGNDYLRAKQFAAIKFKDWAVVGAKIKLGTCFDLSNTYARQLLREGYKDFVFKANQANVAIPVNKNPVGYKGNPHDLLGRFLDRAVIEHTYNILTRTFPDTRFDSIRAPFQEGIRLYPNSGFREFDHIQLCIRNPACIQSLFEPEF